MIILIGRAGTGKSTQGQRIAKDLGCEWISVGNILREHMSSKFAKQMLAGEILQDNQVLPLIDEALKKAHADKNEVVLDGSPRTMVQAEWLVDKVKKGDIKMTAVIHLNTSKEVARERLLARGRPDDHEEAINERFLEYEKVIMPILQFLEEQGFPILHIDAERTPEEVESEIEKLINDLRTDK